MRDRNDRNNDYSRRDVRHSSDDERMARGDDQRFTRRPQGDQAELSPRYDRDQGDFEQRRYDQDNRFQSNRDWEGQQRSLRGRGHDEGRMQERSHGDQSFQERGYQSYEENWRNPGYQGPNQERTWGNPGYQDRGYQGSNYGGSGGYGQSSGNQGYGAPPGNQRGWGNQGPSYEGSYGHQSSRDAQGRGFGGGYGGDWDNQPGRPQHFGSMGETNYGNPSAKGRAPRGYKRSDERIQDDICDRLMQQSRIDASDVEVKVANGEVTLTGTIESRALKHQIENMVDAISGVQEIHNQLRVKRMDQGQQMNDDRGMNDKVSMGKSGQATGPSTTAKNSNESRNDKERHAS